MDPILDENGQEIEQELQTDIEQAVNTENAEPNIETEEPAKPEKTFTQAQLDEIIQKRVERERETVKKSTYQEARDAYIAEQGHTWMGKPITTEADYKRALQDQKVIDEFKDKDLPEDVMQEIVEGRKAKEFVQSQEQESRVSEQKRLDAEAFYASYSDVKPTDIPAEVWAEVDKGKTLTDAYTHFENKSLRQRITDLESGKTAEQIEAEKAARSTGSVGKGGNPPNVGYFTPEQVNRMSDAEYDRNEKAIKESSKKWKENTG